MTNSSDASQSLKYGWASLWRAHTSLPREMASKEFTIFVRAVSREEAHIAMGRVILAIYPAADLETAYYNLTSAHELIEMGVSLFENHRLFETGWQGNRVESWVENPVFAVPDAAELFATWTTAREPDRHSAMTSTEVSELDRPLFIAAALRGFRLQRMPDDLYGLFRSNGKVVELVADGLTFKDVANRCGAFETTTLRQAAERDGLIWPDTYESFLALARTV